MSDGGPQQGGVEVRGSAGTSKRVWAPRPPPAAAPLRQRRQEQDGPRPWQRDCRCSSFDHFRIQRELDLFGGQGEHWPPFHLRRRSAIREVLAVAGLVIALGDSGICAAWDQDTGQLLCYLNVEADEAIRSLFINHAAGSLLTVSVFSSDGFQRLRVRATPLAALRAGRPDTWRPLFVDEVLAYPGWVEFDDINDVVVTHSVGAGGFKVWDLRDLLHPRFYVSSQGVADVKVVASGALLLRMHPSPQRPGELPLRVLDLRDGACLRELWLPAGGGSRFEVLELFGPHLLSKREGGPLVITHIAAGTSREVAAFQAPDAFIYLPFNHAFLSFFKSEDAQLWSLVEGRRVASLPGTVLATQGAINSIYVSDRQDLLFVYEPPTERSEAAAAAAAATPSSTSSGSGGGHRGCVRVFDLLAARQVAAVQHRQHRLGGGKVQAEPASAHMHLAHITSLFYDERRHRLFTGTADGRVHLWGVA